MTNFMRTVCVDEKADHFHLLRPAVGPATRTSLSGDAGFFALVIKRSKRGRAFH